MKFFTDFSSFLSRQSSATSLRDQLERTLALAINPSSSSTSNINPALKRPGSNEVLKLDNQRSVEEELVLVLGVDDEVYHLASPRHSHAAPIAEAVS